MRSTKSISVLQTAVLLGLLASRASSARGQEAIPATGSRVRVAVADGRSRIVGSFLSSTADSIALLRAPDATFRRPTADTMTLARRTVTTLEVSDGRHRHFWRSVGWGVASGAVVGGTAGAMAYAPCHQTGFLACLMRPTSRQDAALLGGVAGGILGTTVGLIVGAFYQSEDWRTVTTERVGQFGIVTTPHGAGVRVSLPVR